MVVDSQRKIMPLRIYIRNGPFYIEIGEIENYKTIYSFYSACYIATEMVTIVSILTIHISWLLINI